MLRKEAALELTLALLGILGALLVGAISPGPSFVVVAQTAISRSRADGLAAALGMGLGGVAFGALARSGFEAMVAYGLPVFWTFLFLTGLTLFIFRRNQPAPVFRVPFYPLVPVGTPALII